MPAQKYDFAKLKAEYFASDFWDCKAFFLDKFGKFGGNMTKASTGWRKEKKYRADVAATNAIMAVSKDREEMLRKLYATMDEGLARLVNQTAKNAERLNPVEFDTVWRLVRVENGLPTTITKAENVDITELERARLELDGALNKKTNGQVKAIKRGGRAPSVRGRKIKGKLKP